MIPRGGSVGVVGAGISGLSYSFFLSKIRPDVKISIVDSSNRVGGYIRSEKKQSQGQDIMLEKGPRTLRGVSEGSLLIIDQMIQQGEGDKVLGVFKKCPANKKYLLSSQSGPNGTTGELIQVPDSLPSFGRFFRSPLLTYRMILSFCKEPFVRSVSSKEETVEQFLSRRFCKDLSQNIVSAVLHGIYAGDVKKLSVNSVMGRLVEMEKEKRSIFKYAFASMRGKTAEKKPSELLRKYEEIFHPPVAFSKLSKFLKDFPVVALSGGLESFPKILYKSLCGNENVRFVMGERIRSLKKNDDSIQLELEKENLTLNHLRLTIGAEGIMDFLPTSSKLTALLAKLHYTSIAMVNVYIRNQNLSMSGFGYLVPQSLDSFNKEHLLGVIFDSEVEAYAHPILKLVDEKLNESKLVERKDTKPCTKVTLMFGGHYYDSSKAPSKSSVERMARSVLSSHLHLEVPESATVDVSFIDNCIPQYNVGYQQVKEEILGEIEREFCGFVSAGGMSFGQGVGVPDCVMDSFKGALQAET